MINDVLVAPIGKDGMIGSWQKSLLSEPRAGHGVAVVHNRLLVVSGKNIAGHLKSVSSAEIKSDGTLGEWRAEPEMPEPRFHAALVVNGDWLYYTGGLDESFNATDTIFRSHVGADGALAAWEKIAGLPSAQSHHSALVRDSQLWVFGGLSGNPMAQDQTLAVILRAPLGEDGSIGAFVSEGTLELPSVTQSNFVFDDAVYLVGGLSASLDYLADVRRAPFIPGPDHKLGKFEVVAQLPEARSHVHQTPYYQGHIYSIGGSVDYDVVSDKVWVGNFQ